MLTICLALRLTMRSFFPVYGLFHGGVPLSGRIMGVVIRSRKPAIAPGPPSLRFFLNLPQFRRDPLRGFFQAALDYGDIVRYRGVWVSHQLSHPDHIQQVLQGNFANYRKGRGYKILKLSLGEGLLTSEGALWQRQRKMTQPSFQGQQVASFTGAMAENALAMLRRWERHAAQGEAFDVVPDFMGLTLNIAAQALFTTNLEADAESIRRTLDIGRDYSVDSRMVDFPAALEPSHAPQSRIPRGPGPYSCHHGPHYRRAQALSRPHLRSAHHADGGPRRERRSHV
jgi:cytochrome P450